MAEITGTIDPIIQKILDVVLFIRIILGDECLFTISNTTQHLHVDQGTRLKLPVQRGSEIKEGSVTYGCMKSQKAVSYKVDAKVYGVAYIGKAFPVRNDKGEMVGSINLGIPIDTQEKIIQMAGDLDSSLQKISNIADGLSASSKSLSKSVDKLMNATTNVENSTTKIYKVVKILNTISTNTKVLGINAAIQSAHAGEIGVGFGVVSREIRSLAESAKNSVLEIDNNMKEILNAIKQFSTESQELSKVTLNQSGLSDEIVDNMNSLSEISNKLSKIAEELITI